MPPSSEPVEQSPMPSVARPRGGISGLAIAIGMVVAALLLFGVLDARRRSLTAPAVVARGSELATSEALPPLYIPPEPSFGPQAPPVPPEPRQAEASAPPPLPRPYVEPATALPQSPPPIVVQPQIVERAPRTSGGATVVLDTSQPRAAPEAGAGATSASAALLADDATSGRARAGSIANRTTTVPQGTLISAVLETAFNSSRAGFARALVQRDVRGFDGKRVLIPRGSRLIGEYRSDATPGQNRALINWTRLIRPDGATIAIGSPATDTLGTGGVRAKVNTHFFERFSGAILQSILDVGVNLASESTDTAVVIAPGTLQGTTTTTVPPVQIPPTLTVKQGTSISVFVARDLDFTDVENGR